MSEKKPDKSYGLEPSGDDPPASPATRPDEAETTAPEPEEFEEPSDIKALDVCPNCGSPLGGVDAVVCLRCGFDLKRLKVIKVETGEATVPDADEPETATPLSVPGAGDRWAPLAMAVVSLSVLAVGYLAGAQGLFNTAGEAARQEGIGFATRLEGLVGMLVRTGVLTLAGLGGLAILAQILDTRLGDVRLAAARMLGIASAIGLLAFFNVNSIFLEVTVEAVCQAIAFVGLAMLLFRLTLRDAATLMGITVFVMIGLLLVSALVLWSAGPQG